LFAGKIHALLCRNWKQRVKGRDFYDFIWYLSRGIPLNLSHLEARMRQSGHWNADIPLDRTALVALLCERFEAVDFSQAKADVAPFIKGSSLLDLWNEEFFKNITRDKLFNA